MNAVVKFSPVKAWQAAVVNLELGYVAGDF